MGDLLVCDENEMRIKMTIETFTVSERHVNDCLIGNEFGIIVLSHRENDLLLID